MRVKYNEMLTQILRVLSKYELGGDRGKLAAKLFADASRDGVYSHGLNRFPAFIRAIEDGDINVQAKAEFAEKIGILERWNGNHGPGNLNACTCMERAMKLAEENMIGIVGLSNTNHWMRPGNYGLMAAEAGQIGILWTNTLPNMPPWGGQDARLGNNPLVIAIPNGDAPMLLDIAMSMFSYGKMESYARQGKELPVDGGFNDKQQLTRNAAEIVETQQALPFGFWKGSGLSLALDLVAAAISGGRTTRQIGELPHETEVSQVFIAVDVNQLPDRDAYLEQVKKTLEDLQSSTPMKKGHIPTYPGQNMMRTRMENMRCGIPVEEEIWELVKGM